MHSLVRHFSRPVILLFALLGLGAVSAQGSLGASYGASGSGSSFTFTGSYMPFGWDSDHEYAAGVRAEASFAPGASGLAFGTAGVLSVRDGPAELFGGAGVGLASGGTVAAYGFTGVRFLFYQNLYAAVEFTLAGNGTYSAAGLRVGIDWLFGRGGNR